MSQTAGAEEDCCLACDLLEFKQDIGKKLPLAKPGIKRRDDDNELYVAKDHKGVDFLNDAVSVSTHQKSTEVGSSTTAATTQEKVITSVPIPVGISGGFSTGTILHCSSTIHNLLHFYFSDNMLIH